MTGLCFCIFLLFHLAKHLNSSGAGIRMVLDLAVLQLAFGFQFSINVAQIICIILAICMYKGLVNKL